MAARIEDLTYDPSIGQFVWNKHIKFSRIQKGDVAGFIDNGGYRIIRLNGKEFSAHRLIWEHFNGPIPVGMKIDHIDGDTDNNHLINLRLATPGQNTHNSKIPNTSKSKIKGVCWCKVRAKWQAKIAFEGQIYRRWFDEIQNACDWVIDKREELHGEFANHGIHEKDIC